ncbi:MAG: DUF5011 domain-containing protein [Acholeplasmataceae bacterium]|nr:DUF5011 domain-containing protein [Acholeplasmataceae bacterium]
MKKIKFLLLFLILIITLFGCNPKQQVVDSVPPSIIGAVDITYYIDDELPDFLHGISATDAIDGDVTGNITYDLTMIDFNTPGIYNLSYFVFDSSDNTSKVTVVIIVIDTQNIEDVTPPLIFGVFSFTYNIGDDLPDLLEGAVAYDPEDGNLTDQIEVDDTQVNYTEVGVYDIVFSVSDGTGNNDSDTIQITVQDVVQAENIDYLNIYYINDFHGAILEDGSEMGLSNIGNLISNEKTLNPENTLFIGGGDILQGSLLSNYYNGASTMSALIQMQLDAFTIGNHEFDWGIDVITDFRDQSSGSIQATFPLLGANIFLEGTQTRPDYIDAYTVIEKGNLKIGIIGVIGSGLESSIATSKIEGYFFDDPVYWTAYYAEQLRTIEQVDVVLAVIHDNGINSGYNQSMSALTGNQRIDAVFNGHSHSAYADYITRTGVRLPYIQSGANGNNLGKVTLEFDEFKQVTQAFAVNLTASSDNRFSIQSDVVQPVIDIFYNQVEPLITRVIIRSGAYMSESSLTTYMAELIRLASDSDIGFHNSGGTRASIQSGQNITIGTLYEIFPFDNKIKTTYLTGAQIKAFMSTNYGSYNSTRVDNMVFEDDVYYKAATNDYVFDYSENPFVTGVDSEDTGILIRDVLEQVLRKQALTEPYFLLTNPIVLSNYPSIDVYLASSNDKSIYLSIN